jgi:hypothetical protein
MTTPLPPGPQGPEPLSERERKILSQIEGDLLAGDPDLADISATVGRPSRPVPRSVDRVLAIMAVLVVAVVLLPARWLAVLAVLGVVVGLPLVAAVIATWGMGKDPRDPPHQG